MIRHRVVTLGIAAVFIVTASAARAQSAVDTTGNWTVSTSGEALANGTLKLEQHDSTIVGSYGPSGTVQGKFQPGTLQVNATWNDARGAGWMTIVFASDGRRLSGEWGRPGSKPSGYFTAVRFVYPSVSGLYNVSVAGGPEFTSRRISLHQLALDVVGNFGPGTQLSGTMASETNALNGTWKGPGGSGWIKLQFADDSKTFQGSWGVADGTEPSGHIEGTVVDTTQLSVKGLWQIASSGSALAGNVIKLDQRGQTVTGSYKDGHLQGMLPRGSHSLSGTWKDPHGTGVIVLTFGSDGMTFHGTWTAKGKYGGTIIGKRVIAATPALRH